MRVTFSGDAAADGVPADVLQLLVGRVCEIRSGSGQKWVAELLEVTQTTLSLDLVAERGRQLTIPLDDVEEVQHL